MFKLTRRDRVLLALFIAGALVSSSLWGSASGQALASGSPARAAVPGASKAVERNARTSWRTYRDTAAGYAVSYPTSWNVTRGTLATVFAPPHGGTGITITVQLQASDGPAVSDIPNGHCQIVRLRGLSATRCFDTLSFSTFSTVIGAGRTYTISTGKRANLQVYNHLLRSFRLIA